MKIKKKPTFDDLFISVSEILKQTNHEEQFRGHVLSLFANLENIAARIISTHYSLEKNYWKNFLYKINDLPAHTKISRLNKILKQKKYLNQNYDYENLIKELVELKEKRNQLAHNIIDPFGSEKSIRKNNHEIPLIVIKKGKIIKISFGIKEQKELDDKLNHVYSQLKSIHRFVKDKNGYKELEWYP